MFFHPRISLKKSYELRRGSEKGFNVGEKGLYFYRQNRIHKINVDVHENKSGPMCMVNTSLTCLISLREQAISRIPLTTSLLALSPINRLFVSDASKLFKPGLDRTPVDVFEKRLNIIGPFQAVIEHEGMFKDIHDQYRHAALRMPRIMLIDQRLKSLALTSSWYRTAQPIPRMAPTALKSFCHALIPPKSTKLLHVITDLKLLNK